MTVWPRVARLMGLVNQACKRPLRTKRTSKRKKPRIKDLLSVPPKPESQRYPAWALMHTPPSVTLHYPFKIHGYPTLEKRVGLLFPPIVSFCTISFFFTVWVEYPNWRPAKLQKTCACVCMHDAHTGTRFFLALSVGNVWKNNCQLIELYFFHWKPDCRLL